MMKETKSCRNCQKDFVVQAEDFLFYEKMQVPPPTFCPECRLVRRALWRNERTFYRRACDMCKRGIISMYPEDATFPVYCQKCWWGDGWDPYGYARDYDPERSFIEQFKELLYSVPALSIMNDDGVGSVASEYTYDFAYGKNCYLVVASWHVENGMYSFQVNRSKDVVDCLSAQSSELMYESAFCDGCYGCSYCFLCYESKNCYFSYDLRNCSDCVLSVGLRNKKNCIRNVEYSQEEYKRRVAEMDLGSRKVSGELLAELETMKRSYPRKYANLIKCVDSTGDMLRNCKKARSSFLFNDLEDCGYMVWGDGAKDSYDCLCTGKPQLCYEAVTPDESSGCIATVFSWKCRDVSYSNNCHSSENLLGCSGIKKGSYVILNKKYSKEEYLVLREKIVADMKKRGEWGEFFPASMAPYAYNESAAQEYLPFVRGEAITKGYRWKDVPKKEYQITKLSSELPDRISETPDSITQEIVECAHALLDSASACNHNCSTAFRIIPRELDVYRKLNVPIPTLCPNCRYYARLKHRPVLALWKRGCMCALSDHFHGSGKCTNDFETTFSPESQEIVYCEQCYNSEVA